jgi:hypothetical protein
MVTECAEQIDVPAAFAICVAPAISRSFLSKSRSKRLLKCCPVVLVRCGRAGTAAVLNQLAISKIESAATAQANFANKDRREAAFT